MKIWFKQLSRLAQIVVIVVALHLVCLTVWSVDYLWHRAKGTKHKIAVNLVRIEAPSKPVPKPAPQVAAAPKPVAKKAVPKTAKSKPAPPTTKPKQDALLQEIATHLEAISAPSKTSITKAEVHIPVLATPQASPASSGSEETIAQFLQESLTLPEFGEVRVQLSIDRRGRLRSAEVLHTKSEKNAAFLRNRLPELQFPCLNEDTSLTIVFSNAL